MKYISLVYAFYTFTRNHKVYRMNIVSRILPIILTITLLSGCMGSRDIATGTVGQPTATVIDLPSSVPENSSDVTPSYILGPNDVINVNVFREPDLTFPSLRLDATGRFEMPLIGRVDANNKNIDALSAEITERYGRDYLVNPQISINIVEVNSKRLTVEGAVNNPGVYIQPNATDLLSAIAIAGGPTDTAKLKEIAVFRVIDGENRVAAFDVKRIRSGELSNPVIYPGDIVVVGFDGFRTALQDILQAAPFITIFQRF